MYADSLRKQVKEYDTLIHNKAKLWFMELDIASFLISMYYSASLCRESISANMSMMIT